jgi:Kinesin motor domain
VLSRRVGVLQVAVGSAEEALDALRRGSRARQKARTALNGASSRSHSIFTIVVDARQVPRAPEPLVCPKCLLVSDDHDPLAGHETISGLFAGHNRSHVIACSIMVLRQGRGRSRPTQITPCLHPGAEHQSRRVIRCAAS